MERIAPGKEEANPLGESRTPTLRDLHLQLPESRRRSMTLVGLGLLAVFVAQWIIALALAVTAEGIAVKMGLCTFVGMATGMLFVIGHDASHGSLTNSRRLNAFAAWVAFLPSFHSPETWDWGHNRKHHSWTNLRTRDPGYVPPTIDEWQAMSFTQRSLFRLYYTIPGMGFYYMIHLWWRDMIWLTKAQRRELKSERRYWLEMFALLTFLTIQIGVVWHFGAWREDGTLWQIAEAVLCIVWPFVVWNWVMAFVTIQHHTHPQVRWFDDEKEWSVFAAQVGGTVHIKLPRLIELGFANIFEHTAHHVDKRIPLYRLPAAQTLLEKTYADTVIVQEGSLRHLRRVLKTCRLYDYQHHRWLDFDGTPTHVVR